MMFKKYDVLECLKKKVCILGKKSRPKCVDYRSVNLTSQRVRDHHVSKGHPLL